MLIVMRFPSTVEGSVSALMVGPDPAPGGRVGQAVGPAMPTWVSNHGAKEIAERGGMRIAPFCNRGSEPSSTLGPPGSVSAYAPLGVDATVHPDHGGLTSRNARGAYWSFTTEQVTA